MDVVQKLRTLILEEIRRNVPVQTVWATAKASNMQQGTMTAERNGAEYFNVLLGLGGDLVEPTDGSRVLLGIIENKPAAAFLLLVTETATRRINGNAHGGLVIADKVAERLQGLEQEINDLKQVLAAWTPVSMDGGAALKAAAAVWYAQPIEPTVSSNLQNDKVSHG